MKKLRLEDLQIDSFETLAVTVRGGTVKGYATEGVRLRGNRPDPLLGNVLRRPHRLHGRRYATVPRGHGQLSLHLGAAADVREQRDRLSLRVHRVWADLQPDGRSLSRGEQSHLELLSRPAGLGFIPHTKNIGRTGIPVRPIASWSRGYQHIPAAEQRSIVQHIRMSVSSNSWLHHSPVAPGGQLW